MTSFDLAGFVIAALIGVICGLVGLIASLFRLGYLLVVDENLGPRE